MPGPTLLGEIGNWVGDEELLNCCVENPDEPPGGDDFISRMREKDQPGWVDTRKDVPDHLYFGESGDGVGVNGESDYETPEDADSSVRETLHLPLPDYTKGMQVAVDEERVSAGSISRQPISRNWRFSR